MSISHESRCYPVGLFDVSSSSRDVQSATTPRGGHGQLASSSVLRMTLTVCSVASLKLLSPGVVD